MPPPVARKFLYQAAGELIVGLSFHSEAELEAWLTTFGAGGTVVILTESSSAPGPAGEQNVRPVGRPSFDAAIDMAIEGLGRQVLEPSQPLRARARLVQKHIARDGCPDDVPAISTIEHRIAERIGRPARSRRKCRQNSDGASVAGDVEPEPIKGNE